MLVARVWCLERQGMIRRDVVRMDRTPANILQLYDRLQGVPNFMEGSSLGRLLASGVEILLVDNVGVLVAVDIIPGEFAHAHMTFWDGQLRGREALVRTAAEVMMEAYDLQELWTAVPTQSAMVLAFTNRVGFTKVNEYKGNVALRLLRTRELQHGH
jgi:hypothetical protein